ncbi:MAG: hypothetical protein GTO45_20525 [Candidatus Aminicenantes bacterium]|nr:hypothetical protein [Candidatus Aminicenantes bacterium]NIM81174.1 hypothetical protein [Candidatus Aminicenantes bacterium]NIN20549.1 hypothetical protein [Candidatus Aminicenantes bacterium]NIN44328.1 hypothetical protein [Candidatus Aminicenantes bacterium]NIN87147.1 hypothetical protein [Candidatus Aminicenantes bacterium]
MLDCWVSHFEKKARRKITQPFSIKNFCGVQGALDSAVFNNVHGGDRSHETSDAVIALQMIPHAVGFL